MIRFRHADDEKLYLALRTEIYLRVAALPPKTVSEIMRNFGKLEAILHTEGLRQGLAIGEIAALLGPDGPSVLPEKPALEAHAAFYGLADTPLKLVEQATLKEIDFEGSPRPWLDDKPIQFPPQTLAEMNATNPTTPRIVERVEMVGPPRAIQEPSRESLEEIPEIPAADIAKAVQPNRRAGQRPKKLLDELDAIIDAAEGDLDDVLLRTDLDDVLLRTERAIAEGAESPQLLDRLRDTLKDLLRQGWKPTSWADLIMKLHLVLQIDAGFLDLQLVTEAGRTVLDQCGLFDMKPGPHIVFQSLIPLHSMGRVAGPSLVAPPTDEPLHPHMAIWRCAKCSETFEWASGMVLPACSTGGVHQIHTADD